MNDELALRARARVGTVLRDKYVLERVLGVGGMAAVYAASHRNRHRVAVKVLHPELAIDASLRRRFIQEGYAANTVDHPGVVRVLDDDVAEDGAVFLVMDLLEGETLDARWERRGRRLSTDECVPLLCQLLDVLDAAHTKGVVHRDIKPENLFVTRDGRLKVLDFGIARVTEGSRIATRTGRVFGTPGYMPPEQALGRVREVDALSDLWAVGATAFALLSGRHVHEGETAEELVVHTATKPAPPIATVVADISPKLAAIIDRALAFEKGRRWPSARAMRDALGGDESFGSRIIPASADAEIVSTDLPTLPASTMAGFAARGRTARSGHRSVVLGSLFVAVVLVVTVVGVFAVREKGPAGPSAGAWGSPSVPAIPSAPQVAVSAVPAAVACVDGPRSMEVAPSALPPSAPRVPVVRARPAAPRGAKPPAAPSASPAPGCDPPFVVDATGTKRWKVECL